MANGEFLLELKGYAEAEETSLPPKLFQRLMLKATAQVLDETASMKKALDGFDKRMADVEKRHCDEDKLAEKKDGRRWDLNKSLLVGVILLILTNVVGWAVQFAK